MEGVLKSWAVPRGPPLTPGTKRLAIQVEDHAIEYGWFEGTIPEGEYGAGKVEIWDRGEYVLLERSPQAMKIDLQGKKLTGNYALQRGTRPAPMATFQTSQAERQKVLIRVAY
jgi:DNA ligase D-like protein (predicted 3'-phosphoesterase)